MANSVERIRSKCSELAEFLVAKNRSYGDSALKPVGIFAKGRASDLIRVRLDDKLNRIRNAPGAFGEDVVKDLLGYLVLYQLALEDEGSGERESGKAGGEQPVRRGWNKESQCQRNSQSDPSASEGYSSQPRST